MAILVKFKCVVGEYEHIDMKIFDRKKSEWGYCKNFWSLKTKNELSENCFWDDWMMNAVKVYSEKTISKKEVEQLNNIGVW